MSDNSLEFNISLSVLEDLGLRLYSSTPAVLSEIVANAWDADAENVSITVDPVQQTITIHDDGEGMTFEEANTRYLTVGYRRRENQPTFTPKHSRPVMGRKGIGKLAPLAIANHVGIRSVKDGHEVHFILDYLQIKADIKANSKHYPKVIRTGPTSDPQGTTIHLDGLRSQVQWAEPALRKRLARRFTIFGGTQTFNVTLNDDPVTPEDVDYYSKVEYAWGYNLAAGDQEFNKLSRPPQWEQRSGRVVVGGAEEEVVGWLGTVKATGDLTDADDSFSSVVVFARGKLIHENALALVNDNHLFTKYLIGELNVDWLDSDAEDDIATSSRQSLIENDPRVEILKKFIKGQLSYIAGKWGDLRAAQGSVDVANIPVIQEWLEGLGSNDTRKKAKRLLGKIWGERDNVSDPRELLAGGILLFENMKVRDSLDALDSIEVAHVEQFNAAFELIDDLEATQFYSLMQARLKVINKLSTLTNADEKESVLQRYVASELWLMDPAWDAVTTATTPIVEKSIRSVLEQLKTKSTKEETDGRIDILYSRSSSCHVIIELKRYRRKVAPGELYDQCKKYRDAVRAALRDAGRGDEVVEVVCLVGRYPDPQTAESRKETDDALKNVNARILCYDELMANAQRLYDAYLQVSVGTSKLTLILQNLRDADLELG